MKQNIIFVALLLATLSMVNAVPYQLRKRAISFADCASGSPIPLTVTAQPDTPTAGEALTLTITGTPTNDLDTGSNLTIQMDENDPDTVDFCTSEGITCPVTAGTAFTTTQQVTVPDTAPSTITVTLTDATGAVVGCSEGTVTA
jgi:hypothetical protein